MPRDEPDVEHLLKDIVERPENLSAQIDKNTATFVEAIDKNTATFIRAIKENTATTNQLLRGR